MFSGRVPEFLFDMLDRMEGRRAATSVPAQAT
jgi:hypothetical protein